MLRAAGGVTVGFHSQLGCWVFNGTFSSLFLVKFLLLALLSLGVLLFVCDYSEIE